MTPAEEVREWCLEYSHVGENLFVARLREGGLDDEQILTVIAAMADTCGYCWNDDRGCHCMNDE